MDKVIVERPRLGSRQKVRKGYRKQWQRFDPEEFPHHEGIFAHKGRTKFFNEHLGPLRRYLRKQVGRPWNKVFADVCENLRCDSVVQSHVRDHLVDIVAVHVEERDGVRYRHTRWGGTVPLVARGWLQLFVCPRTGILRLVEPRRPTIPPNRICETAELQYHRVAGQWFEVRLRKIPAEQEGCWDAFLEKPLLRCTPGELTARYGFGAYALSKRPLNRKDCRKMNRRACESREGRL
jgi:hypothetical protein